MLKGFMKTTGLSNAINVSINIMCVLEKMKQHQCYHVKRTEVRKVHPKCILKWFIKTGRCNLDDCWALQHTDQTTHNGCVHEKLKQH